MATNERTEAPAEVSEAPDMPGSRVGPLTDPTAILDIGMGFMRSKVLLTAVRLGVFSTLAGQTLGFDALRASVGVHERGARDFFDSLVALGLLQRDGTEYRNAPVAEEFLDTAKPYQYVGGMLEEADTQWFAAWAKLADTLGDGVPRWIVSGENPNSFDEIYAEPDQLARFHRAMVGGVLPVVHALPDRFPWQSYTTVADIGCCGGVLLAGLLARYPHLDATGFDLPALQQLFEKTVADHGLGSRMRFSPGSFFTDPLPTADVHVFGHVLHNWDLDTKRMLLRKSYDALAPGGAVVIYETLIDDERRERIFGLVSSLHMLVLSPGGYDYTGAEGRQWLDEAGFSTSRVEHLVGHDFMIVGIK